MLDHTAVRVSRTPYWLSCDHVGDAAARIAKIAPVSLETVTYTFTKSAYKFDAAGLRASMEQIARTFAVEITVIRETRRLVSVDLEFAVTGLPDRLEDFRAAAKPSGGTTDWIQLLTSG